jgi:hypothetical protein
LPSQSTGSSKSCSPGSRFAIGFPPSIESATFVAPVTFHLNSLIVGALHSIGFGVALKSVIEMLVLLDAVVGGVAGVGAAVVVVLGGAVVDGVVVDGAVLVLVGASVEVELVAFLPPLLHAASSRMPTITAFRPIAAS